MTELEMIHRAKMYMDKLAQGIDPISGMDVPEDSVLNQVRLARCFFFVSNVLEKVIENGGTVGSKAKLAPFYVTSEILAGVVLSSESIRITQLVARINEAVNNPAMKKLSTTTITNWLLEKGFLEKIVGIDGKSSRLPTQSGAYIGLSVKTVQGQYGEYQAVMYSAQAQRFVLDHLPEIVAVP